MATLFRTLPAWTWAAGQSSAATFDLRTLPSDDGLGSACYVREIRFRVTGTVTENGAASTANLARALARVSFTLPSGIGAICDVSGSRLVREYRAMNGGDTPLAATAAHWTGFALTGGAAADAVDFTYQLVFSQRSAASYDDDAIPVALVKKATLTVTAGALADMGSCDAASLTVTPTVVLVSMPYVQMPALTAILQADHGALTEPPLSVVDGKILSYCIVPTSDGIFPATTDLVNVGFKFDGLVMSETGSSVNAFYDTFNENATTAIANHTGAITDRSAFLPIVAPPGLRASGVRFASYESVPAKSTPHYVANVCANAMGSVYRVRRSRGDGWYKIACALVGLDPGKAKSAQFAGDPKFVAEVANYLPVRW